MMEHATDRLFWTLTSMIVAALLLTIGIKTFPQLTQNVLQPVSGIMKQADTANGRVSDAANQVLNQSNNSASNNEDAIEKANAVQAKNLGITITDNGDGTGAVTAYDISKGQNVHIPKYTKLNNKVIKITSIGDWAFTTGANKWNGIGISSIELPNTLTSIGTDAFYGNKLTSVNIPNSVSYIGAEAFDNNQISTINIPTSLKRIEPQTFANNQISSITIPYGIEYIGYNAFQANLLSSIELPESLKTLDCGVFNANYLTTVKLPNSLSSIGTTVFTVNKLKSVNIPNSQAYRQVMDNAKNWLTVDFDSSVTVTNNPSSN